MGYFDRFMKQTAVYWANPVNNGFGDISFDDPSEITCRWEDKVERIEDPDGNEIVADAVVYYTSKLELGEYLFLGFLEEMDSASQPDDSDVSGDSKRIVKRSFVPSVNASETLYKYYLR